MVFNQLPQEAFQCAVSPAASFRSFGLGIRLAFPLDRILGNEFPIELAGTEFEEFLKSRADRGLVLNAKFLKPCERGVIGGDCFVRRLETQGGRGRAGCCHAGEV